MIKLTSTNHKVLYLDTHSIESIFVPSDLITLSGEKIEQPEITGIITKSGDRHYVTETPTEINELSLKYLGIK